MSPKNASTVDHPKQRRLRAPVRRERILEAALRVFAERGFDASIGEVATASGITRTVLYYYFPTKQELFLAVLEVQAAELLGRLAPLVSSEGSQEERARALLDAALVFADEQPLAFDMLFRQGEEDDPEVREARRRVFVAAKASLSAQIGPELGSSGLDPESVSGQMAVEGGLAAVLGIIRWWREHPSVPRQEVTDAIFEFFWSGVSGILLATPPTQPGRRAAREGVSGRTRRPIASG